jgi:hypothetical protein
MSTQLEMSLPTPEDVVQLENLYRHLADEDDEVDPDAAEADEAADSAPTKPKRRPEVEDQFTAIYDMDHQLATNKLETLLSALETYCRLQRELDATKRYYYLIEYGKKTLVFGVPFFLLILEALRDNLVSEESAQIVVVMAILFIAFSAINVHLKHGNDMVTADYLQELSEQVEYQKTKALAVGRIWGLPALNSDREPSFSQLRHLASQLRDFLRNQTAERELAAEVAQSGQNR